ncbi:hypothetical protein AYK26_05490 [Euryarchaeota archaeon SM23-78]|nr:MAG: hypothetical protein AYK26_05490 [Euryarchaeota archaeon SM23-78]MBW3000839.1 hypothetical protein [Candidatus Woesearchaeota archaeon]
MTFKLGFDLGELTNFILRARKHGYVGGAEKLIKPQRPGFKEFQPYVKGDFEYVDSYAGYYYAPGQEVIRYKEAPVWNMSYNGGMLLRFHGDLEFSKKTYEFLKKALAEVKPERPFRGPERFTDGNFKYHDESEGDITNFKGTERIFFRGVEVYRQDYIGGLIIPKGYQGRYAHNK